MTPQSNQYNNKYTHNFTFNGHNCTRKRPCYRIAKCHRCWRTRFQLLHKEFRRARDKYFLETCITITVTRFEGQIHEAFANLSKIREKIRRRVSKNGAFVIFVSIGLRTDFLNSKIVPHLHLLTSRLNSAIDLKEQLKKSFPNIRFDIQEESIGGRDLDFKKLISYLLCDNYRECYQVKPHRYRLMTASNGIHLGRFQRDDFLIPFEF